MAKILGQNKTLDQLEQEFGRTGTVIMNGMIINADYNENLNGVDAIDTYREMLSDPTCKNCVNTIEQRIRSTRWYVEPGSDDSNDVKIAEDTHENLFENKNFTWQEFLTNAMPMKLGVSCNEIMYDEKDLSIKDIQVREPDTVYKWITNAEDIRADNVDKEEMKKMFEEGEEKLIGIEQQLTDGKRYFIPKRLELSDGSMVTKLLVLPYDQEGNNYWGKSVMRAAYKNWYFKDKLEKIHGLMVEKQGVGIMYAIVNSSASDTDKSKIKEMLSNTRANQERYFYIETNDLASKIIDIGFLDMQAGTVADALEQSKTHDFRVAEAMDLDWKLNAGQSAGSFARDKIRIQDFLEQENSRADLIQEYLNRDLIKPWVDMVYGEQENYPKLMYDKIMHAEPAEDIKNLVEAVKTGIIVADNQMENAVRQKLGYEKIDEEMEERDRTILAKTAVKDEEDEKEAEESKHDCGSHGNKANNKEIEELLMETNKIING